MHCLTLLLISVAVAQVADTKLDLKPLMTQAGDLLLQIDPARPLASDWQQIKGKWEVADDVLSGRELASDKHAAVVRHRLSARNLLIAYHFKVGEKNAHISQGLDTAAGHLCRVSFRSDSMQLAKPDQDGPTGPDTKLWWYEPTEAIKPGQWHLVVVEVLGREVLVSLDGEKFLYAVNDAFDQSQPKVYLDLRASTGDAVLFKDFRVWEARPAPNWGMIRSRFVNKTAPRSSRPEKSLKPGS